MKRVLALWIGVVGLVGCHHKPTWDDPSDEHLADAKVLVAGFAKAGADHAALSAALRPKPEDYDVVFVPDAAKKLKAALDPMWESKKPFVDPKPEQTETFVVGATGPQLKASTGPGDQCPSRYGEVADMIKSGVRLYCFRFRKPGGLWQEGTVSDGLVWIDGRWVIFPKPYRVLGAKRPAPAGSGAPPPDAR